jgi:hypothetical protein
VYAQLSREIQSGGSLNLGAVDGFLFVHFDDLDGIVHDFVKDVVAKVGHGCDGFRGHSAVGVNLFQDCEELASELEYPREGCWRIGEAGRIPQTTSI